MGGSLVRDNRFHLFQSHLQVEAEFLAEKFDLRVIFQGKEAKTDGNTIWLPSLPENIDNKISRVFRGYLAHEVGHCRYTDWAFHRSKTMQLKTEEKANKAKAIDPRILLLLLNIYEDPFVDREISSEFPGCKENLLMLHRFHKEIVGEKEYSAWEKILLALYYKLNEWDIKKYPELNPAVFGEDANQIVDTLLKNEIKEHKTVTSTRQNFDLAERTYNKLKEFIEEQNDPTSDDPEDEESDENEEQSPQNDNVPKQAPAGEKLQLDSKFIEELCQAGVEDLTNIQKELDKSTMASEIAESLELKNKILKTQRPYTTKYDVYEKVESYSDSDIHEYQNAENRAKEAIDFLRRRMLNVLRTKSKATWARNELKGRLDTQKLSRIMISYPKDIYKKKREGLKLKTAVSILIDASGSMYKEVGQTILVTLSEPLAQLNIPTEVISFATKGTHLNIALKDTGLSADEVCSRYTRVDNLYFRIFKTFDEHFQKTKFRLGSYNKLEYTPLVEGIEYAGRRLWAYKRQKINRKILFIITDGHPNSRAAHKHGKLFAELIPNRCNILERNGIETCGVGLKQSWVKDVFPNHIIIEDLEDLNRLSQDLIKKLQSHFFGVFYERG